MKYALLLISLIFSVQTASADNWTDYITPDTLKSPEGKQLTEKQKRRLGNQRVGTDYSLSRTKRKADELYDQAGYMTAVARYEKLDGIELNEFVMSRMANSFRLNGEYEKAEYWFSQCINETPYPEDYLYYGEVLLINGNCEDAVRWNKEYLAQTLDTSRDVVTDCDQLEEIAKHEAVEVRNLLTLNTSDLDFSPIPYQNGLVFTSNRGTENLTKKRDRWTKENFTDLFFAEVDEGGFVSDIRPLSDNVNQKLHDGTATFNQIGTKMVFSRSDAEGENKKGLKELQLYASEYREGLWSEGRKLNICNSDYAFCHPTFDKGSKKIYFTSNQPGGYGGMDIWMSERENGEWKKPVNLGPKVNTSGNELFPFYAKDGTLYFASNGHRGLGGLDIFYVRQTNAGDDRSWDGRTNMGEPFNSEKDDFSFTIDSEGEKGYFTSNREGGQGGDDIYLWEGSIGAVRILSELIVIEKGTQKRLQDIEVSFTNLKTGKKESLTTDFEGSISLPAEPGINYRFEVEAPGYQSYTENLSGKELMKKLRKLPLQPIRTFEATGTVLNKEFETPLADADLIVFDKCTGKLTKFRSDVNGNFTFPAECGCTYEIKGTKTNFTEDTTIAVFAKEDCPDLVKGDSPQEIRLSLDLMKPESPIGFATGETRKEGTSLNTFFLGSDELTFEEGMIIRLSNLYYDFDKSNIRPDAALELNQVYDLLKTYKTMKISLLSHTDSRGRDRYNTKLSQDRAFSARNYLIKRGIHPDRVAAVGVGEALPVNECSDGVDCTEEQHQLNRRTEIKITALDEPGVKVQKD